jgi:two-component system, LuxR family, response regulator FixJ
MTEAVAYIVDDIEMNRDLLESLMRSVGIATRSYGSARAFLDEVQSEEPGCVLLDIRMPEMSGLDVQKVLNERGVPLPVIIVTAHGDVPVAIQAMKEGAYEFIEKPINNQQVLDVVQRAFRICAKRLEERVELDGIRGRYHTLSPRESEVLDAMVEGRLNKQIAFDLGISQRTVEVHRANVMEKMGAGSLAELVRKVITLRQSDQP